MGLGRESGEDAYEEVQTSAARYFFNIPLQSPGNECLTLVLNRDSGRALLVRSTLLPEQTVEKGSRLKQSFHVGQIVGVMPGGAAPHLTRELIGYRTLNVYSPNHYYEHFYVNTERYAWQNLRGEQFGHGDMDYATYYKFEDEMFLFTFREKDYPGVLGVLLRLYFRALHRHLPRAGCRRPGVGVTGRGLHQQDELQRLPGRRAAALIQAFLTSDPALISAMVFAPVSVMATRISLSIRSIN